MTALVELGGVFVDTRAGDLTLTLDAANVRQEENPYLSLDPELVASYPEEIQRLLGWSMFGSALGWVEIDGVLSDPQVLLHSA